MQFQAAVLPVTGRLRRDLSVTLIIADRGTAGGDTDAGDRVLPAGVCDTGHHGWIALTVAGK